MLRTEIDVYYGSYRMLYSWFTFAFDEYSLQFFACCVLMSSFTVLIELVTDSSSCKTTPGRSEARQDPRWRFPASFATHARGTATTSARRDRNAVDQFRSHALRLLLMTVPLAYAAKR